ncbi:MAG: beta strand repeat-containing protein [Janthinobacterium lividum]
MLFRSVSSRLLGSALLLALPTAALAQTGGVGIGTTTPNASAALDVSSTTQGFLPPRMSQTQRDAINPAATAAGLTVYNTTTGKLNTWDGTKWTEPLASTDPYLGPASTTFAYTGAVQTYTVPAGITTVAVDARGAQGGSYGSSGSQIMGGNGARVRATLTVVPGQVLQVRVGGAGAGGAPGGYNGGGDSGIVGSSGGGATDVRSSGGALTDRLLVAAGGGGGGINSNAQGGEGGAPTGGNGGGGYYGGGGATQTAGGSAPGRFGSTPGSLGTGGHGGTDPTFFGTGGGGGGGYYGGGGGELGAGGGGGSSWVTPTGGMFPSQTAGANAGNGSLTITPTTAPVFDGSNIVNLNLPASPWTQTGTNLYPAALSSNVGIGTNTPLTRLSISPGAAEPKITLYDGGNATNHYGFGTSSGQLNYHVDGTGSHHVFYAGGKNGDGTELLRIRGDGFVNVPGNLHLGTDAGSGTTGVGAGLEFVGPGVNTDVLGLYRANVASNVSELRMVLGDDPGGTVAEKFVLGTTVSNGPDQLLSGTFTPQFTVVSDGSTGIGSAASSPTATLDVAGSARIRNLTTAGVVLTDNQGNLSSSSAAVAFGTSFIQNQTSQQASSNFNISNNGTVGGTLTATNAVVTTALTGNGASVGTAVGLGVRADGGLNLGQNTAGNNLYVGYQAGQATTTGTSNTFAGYQSGQANDAGSFNAFLGYRTGFQTTGSYNTFTGSQSGRNTTTGNNNTFVGYSSGRNNADGSDNTVVGYLSGPTSANLTNATALGANVALTTSNTVVLGNNANVGIGTPAPGQKLEVAGGIKFTGTGSVLTFPNGSTQAVAATSATASNGLTKTGDNIALGGTLAANTDVALNGKNLTFSGAGKIGVGLTNPQGQLANTSVNTLGADNQGGNGESVSWATAQAGYVGQFYNGGTGATANGVAVKIDGTTATATAFDVSKGAQATAGTSLLAVKASGNVGIGTPSPGQKLEVAGQVYSSSGGFRFPDNTVQATGGIENQNTADQAAKFRIGGNGLVAGRVGIGTAAPKAKLDLAGGADNTGANDSVALAFSYRAGGYRHFVRSRHNGTLTSGNALDVYLNNSSGAAGSTAPGTGNVLALSIGNFGGQGQVGIDTDTPAGGLQVLTGNGGVTGGGVSGAVLSGAPGSNPNLELRGSSASTAVTPYVDFAETNSVDYTTRLRSIGGVLNVEGGGSGGLLFKVNGNVQATNVTYTSDRRFKTNVRPLGGALASVLALRGVRYEWNALGIRRGGKAGAGQVGLIAQELEQVYPELVFTDADGYKSVNYAQLTPVLIEALKELTARNAALEARVAQAEADHADLQTLKAQLARLLGEPAPAAAPAPAHR